jgi:hypothetical protein
VYEKPSDEYASTGSPDDEKRPGSGRIFVRIDRRDFCRGGDLVRSGVLGMRGAVRMERPLAGEDKTARTAG